mmetsp:Transcript_122539/g.191384  ORF Transcript_122539/g.191384 Transcript_122539/m.191384 type:complete len:141 (-) Transcript_122539:31-453(-)
MGLLVAPWRAAAMACFVCGGIVVGSPSTQSKKMNSLADALFAVAPSQPWRTALNHQARTRSVGMEDDEVDPFESNKNKYARAAFDPFGTGGEKAEYVELEKDKFQLELEADEKKLKDQLWAVSIGISGVAIVALIIAQCA